MEKVENNYRLIGKLLSCMFQRKEAGIHNKNLRKRRWFNVHLKLSLKTLMMYYVSVRSVTCNRNIFLAFPPISLKLFLLDTKQSMGKFCLSFCNLPPPPPSPRPHCENKLVASGGVANTDMPVVFLG